MEILLLTLLSYKKTIVIGDFNENTEHDECIKNSKLGFSKLVYYLSQKMNMGALFHPLK